MRQREKSQQKPNHYGDNRILTDLEKETNTKDDDAEN